MPEPTRDRVADLIKKGLTVREVADILRVSTQNVYKHLKALGIEPPARTEETVEVAS